ncbi:cytochrome P450 [Colletotrichum tofieldiae]|nr:cytochrome P450 [Colletotrichum tofieldiae]GKT79150.1 cytochrome P450 [Colletotrichum tofieldiae]
MDMNYSSPSCTGLTLIKLSSSAPTCNAALWWLALLFVASVIAASIRNKFQSVEIYPLLNETKEEYLKEGKALLARGAKEHSGKPFRVYTGQGTLTVLAPTFAHDLKNDNRLSSTEFLLAYWQAGTPGFEPYLSSGSELIREMIRTHLTQSDVDEAADALRDVFTDDEATRLELPNDSFQEWHEVTLASTVPQIVARVSALVFLGPELCRDPAWLDITINYPSKAMAAARFLRSYPQPVRRLVHWFLPCCRELRQMLRTARMAIEPIQQKRQEQEAEKGGMAFNNALAWIEKLAMKQQDKTAQNAAFQQLGLSVLANASSTDLISQNILDLCHNPDLVGPLREEVLRETGNGWKSSSLYNLKLMDSVLKETLRLKPIASVALGRRVMEDGVKLSDGSLLPRTTGVAVSSANMWDPVSHHSSGPNGSHVPAKSPAESNNEQEIYPDPERFDGRRFLRMRESANNEHIAQLASVSPEHLGFGLGAHACPGRFFGASSAKLIMSNILLKYEFKLVNDEKTTVDPMRFGFSTLVNPRAKVLIRRRKDAA